MRGKEGGLELLPGTVSSGFRRKLHQTVLLISRIGPTILFGNTRQQCVMNSFTLLHTCRFLCTWFLAPLHLFVARDPLDTSLKPRFQAFASCSSDYSEPRKHGSYILSFFIIFFFVSRVRRRNPFRRNHHQLRRMARKYSFAIIC